MPSVFRRIGHDFVDRKGETRTPYALITWCEACNYQGASFGDIDARGNRVWFCGWRDGAPICVGKGHYDGHSDADETSP